MTLTFSKQHPTEEGQYLIKRSENRYELITIVKIPACFEYGVQWDERLAVVEHGLKSVHKINLDYLIGISEKLT